MIRRLTSNDIMMVLDRIETVDIMMADLDSRSARHRRHRSSDPLVELTDGTVVVGEASMRSRIPVEALRALRVAALATIAARRFVGSGVVTAAVLGSGFPAHAQMMLLARHLAGISHLAVHDPHEQPVPVPVLDQLLLAGIGLSLTAEVTEAVRGATVVIAAGPAADTLTAAPLTRGAVVVNADGRPRPALAACAEQIYVDDPTLVVTSPPDTAATPLRRPRPANEPTELGAVLRGGRSDGDGLVLVELLSGAHVDPAIAADVHRVSTTAPGT